MVIEAIGNLIFGLLGTLLALLPDVSWEVNGTLFDTFFDILETACYLLPMDAVGPILTIIVAVKTFQIVFSLINTIMPLVPFMRG